MTYFVIGLIFFLLNAACVFSLIFIERREPDTTWAWLLILILLPGFGFLLYLAIGQDLSREKIFREKTAIDVSKRKNLKDLLSNTNSHSSSQNYMDLIKMNYNNSGSLYTSNNSVKTFINGEDKFKSLLNDLENAKDFIHIEYYIFRLDNLGKEIVKILEKKIKEGVEVRLLVDGMGSKGVRGDAEKYIKSLGVQMAVFFPGLTRLVNLRVNYRNHRKIVVIDGKVGYVGGFNVGDEYINRGKQFDFWRDTHLKIKGDAVQELNKRFVLDWDYAASDNISLNPKYFPDVEDQGDVGLQIVSSGPDHIEEYIKYNYLKIINNAKKSVYLQTPYLVLDSPMIQALKISALSGVDVRIMVPDKPDHFFMEWVLSASIGTLIDSGVKFYRYKHGFIHAKTIVSDGAVSSIGTANLDIRSFRLNFEVNAIIYDNEIAKSHEEIFLQDQEKCDLVTKDSYNNRPRRLKIEEAIIRLISPIL